MELRGEVFLHQYYIIFSLINYYVTKKSGMGCYHGNVYVGSLTYEDDAVHLSPMFRSLNEIRICEQYSQDFQ